MLTAAEVSIKGDALEIASGARFSVLRL